MASSADIPASRRVARTVWRYGQGMQQGERTIPAETPVAFSYQNEAYAVMMATPADLDDFAYGFSLTEGVIDNTGDIRGLETTMTDDGIVLRMMLDAPRQDALWGRRRHLAGPSGCGLCGIESLAEASRALTVQSSRFRVHPDAIANAMSQLSAAQPLNHQTRAVHGAGFWRPGAPLIVREDVGRHNALDKLIGALARNDIGGDSGMIVLTSRVSVEMVQKASIFGAPIIAAVSAPTALAIETAESAGITLIAIARQDGFEVFTHPERIVFPEDQENVA